MSTTDIDRLAREAANAAFGQADANGREALMRLVSMWGEAARPFVIDADRARGFVSALAVPRPKAFHSGRFQGSVNALALTDAPDGPLRHVSVPGAELGPALPRALAMAAAERNHSRHVPNGALRTLSATSQQNPPVEALTGAVGELLRSRLGQRPFAFRLPYDCKASLDTGEPLVVGGEGYATAREAPPRCAPFAKRVFRAGKSILVAEPASMDWPLYARLLLRDVSAAWRASVARDTAAAYARFRSRLDRIACGAMDEAGMDEVALYDWLDGGGNLQARLNRRQALAAYPILAAMTARDDVSAAVDAQRPLADAIAASTGTSASVAKALAGVGRGDVHLCGRIVSSLAKLSGVDPRRLPVRGVAADAQWTSLLHVADGWESFLNGYVQRVPPEAVAARMALEPPHWQRRDGGPARCLSLRQEASNARDFLSTVGNTLLLPLVLDASPLTWEEGLTLLRDVATKPWQDGVSPAERAIGFPMDLAGVVRLSERWHALDGSIHAALRLGEDISHLTWEPLTEPFATGAVTVVPLTCAQDLAEEGEALSHCVGTYVMHCLLHGIHVVSLRKDGRRLSTAEIRFDGKNPRVIQHCARRNGDPPRDAEKALAAYVAELRAGGLGLDTAALEEARAARQRDLPGEDRAAGYVGYDPSDASRRDLAVSLYAFALPHAAPGMTHAEWADASGVRPRLDESLRASLRSYECTRVLWSLSKERQEAVRAWLAETPEEAPATSTAP